MVGNLVTTCWYEHTYSIHWLKIHKRKYRVCTHLEVHGMVGNLVLICVQTYLQDVLAKNILCCTGATVRCCVWREKRMWQDLVRFFMRGLSVQTANQNQGRGGEGRGGEGRGGEGRGGEGRGGEGRGGEGRGGEGREGKGREGKGREGKGREGKGREGKGREGKGREGKGREGKGREGKGREGKGRGGSATVRQEYVQSEG